MLMTGLLLQLRPEGAIRYGFALLFLDVDLCLRVLVLIAFKDSLHELVQYVIGATTKEHIDRGNLLLVLLLRPSTITNPK
jgi:hypothetical protein